MRAPRKKLGEILISAGLLDQVRLATALREQKKWGGRLGKLLIDLRFVTESSMVAALSRQLELPAVDLAKPLDPTVARMLPVQICERDNVIAIACDREKKVLKLATSDPTNLDLLKDISFRTGMNVEMVVAAGSEIDQAIRRYYYGENPLPSSDTAVPQTFGLTEPIYSLEEGDPPVQEPAPAVPQLTASSSTVVDPARSLRTLIELLLQKGVLSQAEYLSCLRGK